MGTWVNLADQTVYPHYYKMHDSVVNMLAHLWHCPKSDDFDEYGVYAGPGALTSRTQSHLLSFGRVFE
jgi:glutamate/tyrosine decarboxylase-like PLP-dependent enzyme